MRHYLKALETLQIFKHRCSTTFCIHLYWRPQIYTDGNTALDIHLPVTPNLHFRDARETQV